jgi:hypothetical protein
MPSSRAKRWGLAALRLSAIVAICFAAWDAYRRFHESVVSDTRASQMKIAYECAAKHRDEDLLKARAGTGNINIRGGPFYCSDRDFWVAMYEIEQVRNGTMVYSTPLPKFDWRSTAASAAIGFVGTTLLALVIAGIILTARWVLMPLSKQ